MSSNPSSSTASRRKWSSFDPAAILLPIFVGFLRAAPFVAFIAMFLRPDFGLTNNSPAPNAWALAAIGAIGFWSVRVLPRFLRDARVLNVALLLLGIVCWIGWMAIEPQWHVGDILRDPFSMVSGHGQFGWTFVVTLIYWIFTLRLALDEREQSSEGVRGIMIRSLVGVMAGVLIAAMIGGDTGDAGLSASYVALPVALVSGIGAVGLSEMATTRAIARRRGATVPGWNRWGRTFLGSAAIILVITFVAVLIFGPGFLAIVMDSLAAIWRGISTVILWVAYGVVYAIYWIVRGVAWLLNLFFDTSLEPMEMPSMEGEATPELVEQPEEEPSEPSIIGPLLRFGGIIVLVIVGLALLARFARYRSRLSENDPDEERTSVFSGSLIRDQLKNLFRRRSRVDRPRKLDLASDPESVRESMLYLQVLAERLGTGRAPYETPHDFTARLANEWPELNKALNEINYRYERVRYGESEEDRAAVVRAWREIWTARQDHPNAAG